ncbi:Hypothetical_protein [Hexamita inflata]|uniref:Hypothetical_protein n=1 Tax=Hexamita inflata TaxID=28002 RepID=A0AA86RMH1_9EUKA|nr:Hypothetical protein HINF_LOCUS56800 [Hexamita inflata]
MSRQQIFGAGQRIPITFSSEKYYQNSITYPKADNFVKDHHKNLGKHITNIQVSADKTHEIYSGDGNVVDKCIMVKGNRLELLSQAHHTNTVSFTLEDRDKQFTVTLKGKDSSILKCAAIKVELNTNAKPQVTLLPAYQILSTQEAQNLQHSVELPSIYVDPKKRKNNRMNDEFSQEESSGSSSDKDGRDKQDEEKDFGDKAEGQDDLECNEMNELQEKDKEKAKKLEQELTKFQKQQDDE